MFSKKFFVPVLLASLSAVITASAATAGDGGFDSASVEIGATAKARMIRLGVQSDWNRRWFSSNGTHLAGYWDLTLAQWRATAHRDIPGENQNITNVGFTPVLRFQADDKFGWYGEAGIGLNLLSQRYNNDGNELSTHFQFGDHVAVGYVFANRWDLGVKAQHFSNGGYKRPNSGVNFLLVSVTRPF